MSRTAYLSALSQALMASGARVIDRPAEAPQRQTIRLTPEQLHEALEWAGTLWSTNDPRRGGLEAPIDTDDDIDPSRELVISATLLASAS